MRLTPVILQTCRIVEGNKAVFSGGLGAPSLRSSCCRWRIAHPFHFRFPAVTFVINFVRYSDLSPVPHVDLVSPACLTQGGGLYLQSTSDQLEFNKKGKIKIGNVCGKIRSCSQNGKEGSAARPPKGRDAGRPWVKAAGTNRGFFLDSSVGMNHIQPFFGILFQPQILKGEGERLSLGRPQHVGITDSSPLKKIDMLSIPKERRVDAD